MAGVTKILQREGPLGRHDGSNCRFGSLVVSRSSAVQKNLNPVRR
jgi:hypothetical protein